MGCGHCKSLTRPKLENSRAHFGQYSTMNPFPPTPLTTALLVSLAPSLISRLVCHFIGLLGSAAFAGQTSTSVLSRAVTISALKSIPFAAGSVVIGRFIFDLPPSLLHLRAQDGNYYFQNSTTSSAGSSGVCAPSTLSKQ